MDETTDSTNIEDTEPRQIHPEIEHPAPDIVRSLLMGPNNKKICEQCGRSSDSVYATENGALRKQVAELQETVAKADAVIKIKEGQLLMAYRSERAAYIRLTQWLNAVPGI